MAADEDGGKDWESILCVAARVVAIGVNSRQLNLILGLKVSPKSPIRIASLDLGNIPADTLPGDFWKVMRCR